MPASVCACMHTLRLADHDRESLPVSGPRGIGILSLGFIALSGTGSPEFDVVPLEFKLGRVVLVA